MIDTVATFQCPLHGVDIPDIPDSYLDRQAVQIFHVAGFPYQATNFFSFVCELAGHGRADKSCCACN
jgi:hypothetical protein